MTSLLREHEWRIKHHREVEKYEGRWIAIVEDRIVSSGSSYREAYERAKQSEPDKTPLVTYVFKKGEELLIL